MQRLARLCRALQQQPCLAECGLAAARASTSTSEHCYRGIFFSPTTSTSGGWSAVRGVHVVVNVHKNNVDQALTRLRRECDAIGLRDELKKREAFQPSDDIKFAKNRRVFNAKMGAKIRERLKWVMRRRKLK
jgi:ribosomal protein S21